MVVHERSLCGHGRPRTVPTRVRHVPRRRELIHGYYAGSLLLRSRLQVLTAVSAMGTIHAPQWRRFGRRRVSVLGFRYARRDAR